MNRLYLILFLLLNQIFIPYRFKKIHKKFMNFKLAVARKLFENAGQHVNLRPHIRLTYMSNISIGNHSSIGDSNKIVAADKVKIGNNVLMGPEIMIFTQNHVIPMQHELLINSGCEKKPVIIEDDVWIGARAIILPGAVIRKGCVVAAGTVVTGKEYEKYSVLGGNPAQVIKKRQLKKVWRGGESSE